MTPTSLVTAQRKNALPAPPVLEPQHQTVERTASPSEKDAAREALGNRASLLFKQVLDYAMSGAFLLLTSPLFLVIAALIKITSPGPIFFVQERVGQGGRKFRFYKFRTMKHNSDDSVHREFSRNFIRGDGSESGSNGNGRRRWNGNGTGLAGTAPETEDKVYKLTRDPRVTVVGQFLRRTSLDELPQLFNVLRGEMSMVGPRPPVVYELEHYLEWHKRRLAAKPGITGLWQVSGRSSVPFDEMVLLDLYYIENRTTAMDLGIMVKTLPVMVKGDGAY
ncbi:MAG: sugar transferase [Candidatus Krumholzibacteriia bacterium]